MSPDSTDVDVELLGINPLLDEKFGNGPHPENERFNDGKVSPDGKFFAGTINDCPEGFDSPHKQYYWTMDGNNQLPALLYRYDGENKTCVIQE